MAQIITRVWRSGPRKVKRVAYGYTYQDTDGKQIRKTDASWTREDAEKAMAARMLNLTPEPAAPAGVMFKAMTERYLKDKEAGGKRTVEYDRLIIGKLVAYFGADTPLTKITAARIAEYRITRLTSTSERTKRKIKPASVNRELSVLRSVLRLAADEECGYLEKAPRVRLEKEPQGRLRYLTEDEASRLLAECRKAADHPVLSRRSPQLYPVVVLALHTGMRRGEILGLEWDRIDFSRGVIQLEITKSGPRREIPMRQSAYDVLAALPKSGSRLFRGSIRKAFESAVERRHQGLPLPRSSPYVRVMVHDAGRQPLCAPEAPGPRGHQDDHEVRASRPRSHPERDGQDGVQHKFSTKPAGCGASTRYYCRGLVLPREVIDLTG